MSLSPLSKTNYTFGIELNWYIEHLKSRFFSLMTLFTLQLKFEIDSIAFIFSKFDFDLSQNFFES